MRKMPCLGSQTSGNPASCSSAPTVAIHPRTGSDIGGRCPAVPRNCLGMTRASNNSRVLATLRSSGRGTGFRGGPSPRGRGEGGACVRRLSQALLEEGGDRVEGGACRALLVV